jgi:hypothetical protein
MHYQVFFFSSGKSIIKIEILKAAKMNNWHYVNASTGRKQLEPCKRITWQETSVHAHALHVSAGF